MPMFTIPVTEYSSAPRRPGRGAPLDPFVLSDAQLVVGMVRSILTSASTRASRRYMAAIVRPTLDFILDWSRVPELRIARDFKSVLRDFSATSRIGELAQGICYAYWLIAKGYVWISDFDSWDTSTGVPILPNTPRPDFVMFNPSIGDIAVMEAKGTLTAKHGQPLGDALAQCNSVLPRVYAMRGFGCALTLDADNPLGRGALHLRDPENAASKHPLATFLIFRRAYASWFEMSGDHKRARWLRDPMEIPPNFVFFRSREQNTKEVRQDPLRRAVAQSLNYDPERVWFDVDRQVWKALHSFRLFQDLELKMLAAHLSSDASSKQEGIYFPDGTRILPEKPPNA